jgi:hypothetical protein
MLSELWFFSAFGGTAAGLARGSARLVLLDGTVPTAVLGLACFASFVTARRLMYRVTLQFVGPQSPEGRDFESNWQYSGFRRTLSVITVVWGAAFLAETVAQVAIIEFRSTSTAKTAANLMPIVVAGIVVAWTAPYRQRRCTPGRREQPAAEPTTI